MRCYPRQTEIHGAFRGRNRRREIHARDSEDGEHDFPPSGRDKFILLGADARENDSGDLVELTLDPWPVAVRTFLGTMAHFVYV